MHFFIIKMVVCSTLVLAGNVLAASKDRLEIISGKALGEATIGATKSSILKRGFKIDTNRDQVANEFLIKGPLLVRVEKGLVVSIYSFWRESARNYPERSEGSRRLQLR